MVAISGSSALIFAALPASNLFPRQTSNSNFTLIPQQCPEIRCQAFVESVTSQKCATLECLCTDNVGNTVKACVQCAVDAKGDVTQALADSTVATFVETCQAAGRPITVSSGKFGVGTGTSDNNGATQLNAISFVGLALVAVVGFVVAT